MAPILPQHTVVAIETTLFAKPHPDLHAIADFFNTTYQTVRRIKIRLNNFLATGIDPRKAPGRNPKFQDEERTATLMRELLSRKPDLHQREIGEYLEEEFGIKVCQATISRLLKRYEIPHKRFKTVEQRHRKGGPPMKRSEVDRELAAAREEGRLREEEREREERERLSQAARMLEESSLLANHGQSYTSPYASSGKELERMESQPGE